MASGHHDFIKNLDVEIVFDLRCWNGAWHGVIYGGDWHEWVENLREVDFKVFEEMLFIF
jgi:hypothetical protein